MPKDDHNKNALCPGCIIVRQRFTLCEKLLKFCVFLYKNLVRARQSIQNQALRVGSENGMNDLIEDFTVFLEENVQSGVSCLTNYAIAKHIFEKSSFLMHLNMFGDKILSTDKIYQISPPSGNCA